ncbi:MAG: hypothetical protein ACD_54C00384G0002, partial [uncultured bacterium]
MGNQGLALPWWEFVNFFGHSKEVGCVISRTFVGLASG